MTNTFYQKYWNKKILGGSQNIPPVWDIVNLKWHYQFFKNYIGKNILDVGAGDGTFSNFIKKKSPNSSINALELSQKAISIGRKKYKSINFINQNIEQLNLKSKKFDTVFAIEVLEHLLDIDLCLSNIYKILKKDGYFCITTTDFNFFKKVLISAFVWEKYFYPNNPHIRFFTKKSLSNICQKHGFIPVKYKWNRTYLGIMPKGQMIVFKKI